MLYPKIESPFRRFTEGSQRNKLDVGNWARQEFELLAKLPWAWTEKIHGTNVRVLWDGHRVRFGGRTDTASMPVALIERLTEMFPEELMEQKFGGSKAILFGEGVGPRIGPGSGNYARVPDFILFDVNVVDAQGHHWWLRQEGIDDVAKSLGIQVVPILGYLDVEMAIRVVSGIPMSKWGDFPIEGMVGTAPLGLKDRGGEAIKMKLKVKDFRHG